MHTSALNVEQEFSGAKPGRVLIEKISEMARAGKIIEAEAVPDIARAYIAQWGCVANAVERDEDGAIIFRVVLDNRMNASLQTRDKQQYTNARFAEMASDIFDTSKNVQVLRLQDDEGLFAALREPFAAGFVMTQLMPREGNLFAVIERPRAAEELRLAA